MAANPAKGVAVLRKLIVTENITLDGVIDASDGWFTPTGAEDVDMSDVLATQQEHMRQADAVLLGRVTYDEFRSYWPHQTEDTTGVTDYLNRTTKYVISGTLTAPDWRNTVVLRGPLADEVTALKESAGQDIVATGSVQLVQALVTTGLVDEYRLFVYPVVLGRGRRLFESGTTKSGLQLEEARAFASGLALLRYGLPDGGDPAQ
jgi:dihydrofolate reductase